MRYIITLLASAITGATASAALPPHCSAPLAAHLVEVNAQWKAQGSLTAHQGNSASFTDEADRIRTHLRMVREELGARRMDGLTQMQRASRARLLQRLGDYADGRVFPRNGSLPYRNPVFIDAYGTACAVGWLMIESGHGGLARSISAGFNLGYVHEIAADARFADRVAAWAEAHGFTTDELAWIQPGYPPNLPWQPFGGGTNGDVTVIEKLADGRLLIAGAFTEAGGISANGVAIWNGTGFEALGNGVQGEVTCAVEHNGSIYVGGAMLNGPHDLARWNGSAWEFSAVFDGKYPSITALHVHADALHAAGTMMGFAGEDHFVQRLNGQQWESVGSAFNQRVLALATHDGELIAAGAFTELAIPTEPIVRHAARFNGTEWVNLAGGLDATVRDLLSADGGLFAAGDLFNNVAPRFGLARLAPGSGTWELLMPGLTGYIYPTLGDPRIERIAEDGGRIYFGGSFFIAPDMMTIGTNIGRWDAIDQVAALALTDATVSAVCADAGQLIIGGAFESWMPHIASLELATGIDAAARAAVAVAPNPTAESVRISGVADASRATVRILDAGGREVLAPIQRMSDSVVLDAKRLMPGAYWVRIGSPTGDVIARFVRE